MKENRDATAAFIARWEGDDFNPNDPGGGSRRGITVTLLSQWNLKRGLRPAIPDDVRNLNDAHADEVMWDEIGALVHFDDLPGGIDLMVMNNAFQLGLGGGLRLLAAVLGNSKSAAIADLVPLARGADAKQLIHDLAKGWIAIKSQSPKWSPRPQTATDDGHPCAHGWMNRYLASVEAAMALVAG